VNADATALACDRTFHHGIDAEAPSDIRQRSAGIFEMREVER
jgi:hypothetical protein